MTEQTATLIAAGIAAGASVITLVLQFIEQRSAEMRAAYRTGLHEHLSPLGEAIHQTLACSTILLKANKSEEAYRKWRDRGREAQTKLKGLRIRVRYQLWGLDEGLNTLTRIPDWTDHARKDPKRADQLLWCAKRLGEMLDRGIRAAYYSGTTPWLRHRVGVRVLSAICVRRFKDGQKPAEDEE